MWEVSDCQYATSQPCIIKWLTVVYQNKKEENINGNIKICKLTLKIFLLYLRDYAYDILKHTFS